MREAERFTIRADDGRTWQVARVQHTSSFQPQNGPLQNPDSYQEYVCLDDPDRFGVNAVGKHFEVVDFYSHADDVQAWRV